MPTRIPVEVAEHQFPSLNQARIYYTDILHSNAEGKPMSEKDQADIFGLMVSSHSKYPTENSTIWVTRGFYGRKCFASVGPNGEQHYLSIIQSLKKCLEPADEKAAGRS